MFINDQPGVYCSQVMALFFTDVNECLLNNGNCSQNCTDTIGSYTCSCYVGYTLNDDRRTCAGKEINKVLKE